MLAANLIELCLTGYVGHCQKSQQFSVSLKFTPVVLRGLVVVDQSDGHRTLPSGGV